MAALEQQLRKEPTMNELTPDDMATWRHGTLEGEAIDTTQTKDSSPELIEQEKDATIVKYAAMPFCEVVQMAEAWHQAGERGDRFRQTALDESAARNLAEATIAKLREGLALEVAALEQHKRDADVVIRAYGERFTAAEARVAALEAENAQLKREVRLRDND